MPTASNRYYSAPPSVHNIAASYSWNPSATQTGGANTVTGNWTANVAPQFNSVSSSTPSGSASAITTGIALAQNLDRREFYIQVVGSGSPLYVAFNSNTAGTGNFNVLLKAASSTFGTDGGTLSNTSYQGPVSVSGDALCYFSIWEA